MNLSLYHVLQALTFIPTFTEDTLEKRTNNVREEGIEGGGGGGGGLEGNRNNIPGLMLVCHNFYKTMTCMCTIYNLWTSILANPC